MQSPSNLGSVMKIMQKPFCYRLLTILFGLICLQSLKMSPPIRKSYSLNCDVNVLHASMNSKFVGDRAYDLVSKIATDVVNPSQFINQTLKSAPISTALRKLQGNMDILDNVASKAPQLTSIELAAIASTVVVSFLAPTVCPIRVTELLVPSMAAVSASIGLSAEYIGKVEVAKGKEIAALAIQVSAEAEALLAVAERAKAILPLCVGVATTASAFALLAPSFVKSMSDFFGIEVLTETMLIFPVLSVLAAAIAGLATQECREVASRAAGLGARRFASSNQVGRTWLSATEQVQMTSSRSVQKWSTFALGVLPAPFIAAFCPGALSYKAVVCAAIAAAQAAYYVATCEYHMAIAVEAVALKSRSAAVADTFANQGSRAGSILPFASALGGLCAAASAATVEVLHFISAVELQCALAAVFPVGAALFAAAASVAKSRCEVGGSHDKLKVGYYFMFIVHVCTFCTGGCCRRFLCGLQRTLS